MWAAILNSICLQLYGSFAGLYLSDLGSSVFIIGVVLAMRNLLQLFFRIPLGRFNQIVGRKTMLITGILFYFFSLLSISFATSWHLVLVGTLFIAIGMSCFWPAIFAYLSDVDASNMGRNTGMTFLALDLGTIFISLISSILLSQEIAELNDLFLIGAIVVGIGTLILFFWMKETLLPDQREVVDSKIQALGSSFLHMIELGIKQSMQAIKLKIFLLQILLAFTGFAIMGFFPLLLRFEKGFPDSYVSIVAFSTGIVLFPLKPYVGRVLDIVGYLIPIIVGLFIASACMVLMVLVDSFPLLIVIYCVSSLSILTCYIAISKGTLEHSSSYEKGEVIGVLGVYTAFGRTVSSLGLSFIWESFGLNIVFIFASIITVLTTPFFWLLLRDSPSRNLNTVAS